MESCLGRRKKSGNERMHEDECTSVGRRKRLRGVKGNGKARLEKPREWSRKRKGSRETEKENPGIRPS